MRKKRTAAAALRIAPAVLRSLGGSAKRASAKRWCSTAENGLRLCGCRSQALLELREPGRQGEKTHGTAIRARRLQRRVDVLVVRAQELESGTPPLHARDLLDPV